MKEDKEIVAILAGYIGQNIGNENSEISELRENNLKRYRGDSYGDERAGHSQIVSRESFESVEWAMPALIKPFVSSGQMVKFTAQNLEDEDQAAQETAIVNHYVTKENNGFLSLLSLIKDCLVNPNGYTKVFHSEQQRRTFETYKGLTEMQLGEMLEDEEYTPIEADQRQEMTAMGPAVFYDVKLQRDWVEEKNEWRPVPGDELLVSEDLTSLDLDEADCIIHRVKKSKSQLVREGFDKDLLDEIGVDSDHSDDSERINRLFFTDETESDEDIDESMRDYWVHECYLWIDADDDGVAEYRQITMIGNEIFENEEVDSQPFVSGAYILNTHRHVGMSMVESVLDLERAATQLKRQLIDSARKANNPRKYVGEGALDQDGLTLQMLMDVEAEYIATGDPSQIVPETHQPIINDVLPVLTGLQEDRKMRTGVSPELNMDPDVLRDSTMGAFMGAVENASQRMELVVRLLAETAVSKVMLKFHRLLRMYPDVQKTIKIRNEYVEVNPMEWRERTDMDIEVGLGSNSQEQTVQILMQLLGLQKEAVAARMAGPEHLYRTLEKLVETAGLHEASHYFYKPEEMPPAPDPTQDPEYQLIMNEAKKSAEDAAKKQAEAQEILNETKRQKALVAADLQMKGHEIANIDADTDLKMAQAKKAESDSRAPNAA